MNGHKQSLLERLRGLVGQLNLGQVVIAICVVGLAIWCAYNVEQVVTKYARMDTIISLENNPPSMTPCPGITVCAPSIFTTEKLSKLYPKSFGEEMQKYKLWVLAGMPKDEIGNYSEKQRQALFEQHESLAMQQYSAQEIIKTLSVQRNELLGECTFYPINLRKGQAKGAGDVPRPKPKRCDVMVALLESIYEGRKCFTFFSDLHSFLDDEAGVDEVVASTKRQRQPSLLDSRKGHNDSNGAVNTKQTEQLSDTKVNLSNGCDASKDACPNATVHEQIPAVFNNSDKHMVFDLNPSIEVVIKALESQIWSNYVAEQILMTVHPPNILQNKRDFLFFQVARNNFYEIAFTKKTTYLLPAPYKTMCVNYKDDPNYGEYKTRDSCITRCILNIAIERNYDCANYYSVLVEEMFSSKLGNTGQKICPHKDQNYSTYLGNRAECEQLCPAECMKTIFEINGQMRNTADMDYCNDWLVNADISDGDYELLSLVAGNDKAESDQGYVSAKVYGSEQPQDSLHGVISTHPQVQLRKWHRSPRQPRSVPHDPTTAPSTGSGETECKVRVSIRISAKPFTTVRHQPAITYEGFIGTVGGHIGIWLGLSLYKIIKFIVQLLYNFFYKIARKCIRKFYANSN